MRLVSLGISSARNRISSKFTLPDRLRGTFVEKWAHYWRGLLSDYAEVVVDVAKGAVQNPRKAAVISGIGYATYSCVRRNPGEESFLQQLLVANNEMIMVTPSLQNPESAAYLRRLQQDINQNRLRFLSLGVCTLLWEDLYDKDDCTYAIEPDYAKVNYQNFHEHIIDVGFWNNFWRLKWELFNFDVNYL